METCFDGSTYVLTSILPISDRVMDNRTALAGDDDGNDQLDGSRETDDFAIDVSSKQPISCLHWLQEILAGLPTSNDAPEFITAEVRKWTAPPSRNGRTHFLRWAVITDLAYNGRRRRPFLTQLLEELRGHRLTDAEAQARLSRPVLLMSVIFDAADGSDQTVERYLRELWGNMEPELRHILPCLVGFESENAATSFVQLVRRYQIKPAFSWSDYAWTSDGLPQGRYWRVVPALVPLLLIPVVMVVRWSEANPSGWEITLAAAIWVTALQWCGKRFEGVINMPTDVPPSPFAEVAGTDPPQPKASMLELRDIRKSIYLRDQMINLLNDLQDATPDNYPQRLYTAFGAFVEDHKPLDRTSEQLMQPAGQARPLASGKTEQRYEAQQGIKA